MTLTLGRAPLSSKPAGSTNYEVNGPAHRILVEDSPKRLRVRVGGETILDTTRAKLLHESNLLPRYYVPLADIRQDALVASDTTTYCPFKGDARYWSVRAGGRTVGDLVWNYPAPNAELPVLRDLGGLYLENLGEGDEVLEEDEVLLGHPHDPYHRVDAQRSSRHVRVLYRAGDDEEVLADTTRPIGVFETGLPPRWYVPVKDVRRERLADSDTTSICPYKGIATYKSIKGGPSDVAWTYEHPLPEGTPLPGHLSFLHDDVRIEVDGVMQPSGG